MDIEGSPDEILNLYQNILPAWDYGPPLIDGTELQTKIINYSFQEKEDDDDRDFLKAWRYIGESIKGTDARDFR